MKPAFNAKRDGHKVILLREKESVTINIKNKTVDFREVEYTFDEVLKIANEIAETFDEGTEK